MAHACAPTRSASASTRVDVAGPLAGEPDARVGHFVVDGLAQPIVSVLRKTGNSTRTRDASKSSRFQPSFAATAFTISLQRGISGVANGAAPSPSRSGLNLPFSRRTVHEGPAHLAAVGRDHLYKEGRGPEGCDRLRTAPLVARSWREARVSVRPDRSRASTSRNATIAQRMVVAHAFGEGLGIWTAGVTREEVGGVLRMPSAINA